MLVISNLFQLFDNIQSRFSKNQVPHDGSYPSIFISGIKISPPGFELTPLDARFLKTAAILPYFSIRSLWRKA